MAERALAHVEKIEWIRPIEGADNIELMTVSVLKQMRDLHF